MGLCGSFRCGCGITSTPAVSGAIDGELPTIFVAGSGEPGDPYDLTLNDAWAQAVADALVALAAVTALVTPSAWTAVSFQNSWTNTGGSTQPTQYRSEGYDRVAVRLACSTGSSGTVAFTLPVGFRPLQQIRRALDGAGAHAYALIETTGTVALVGIASIQGEFSFSTTA